MVATGTQVRRKLYRSLLFWEKCCKCGSSVPPQVTLSSCHPEESLIRKGWSGCKRLIYKRMFIQKLFEEQFLKNVFIFSIWYPFHLLSWSFCHIEMHSIKWKKSFLRVWGLADSGKQEFNGCGQVPSALIPSE